MLFDQKNQTARIDQESNHRQNYDYHIVPFYTTRTVHDRKVLKTALRSRPFSFRGRYNYEVMRPFFADFANLGCSIKDAPGEWRGLGAQNFSQKPRKTLESTKEWAKYQSMAKESIVNNPC